MVTKGQFLERPTLIPVGREVMEGTAHRGVKRPPLLVLAPRPEEGGGMDHVIAAELAWAAATAGFPTLRFNYRGVGGSQGLAGTGEALVEDAEAAMRVLLENAQSTQPRGGLAPRRRPGGAGAAGPAPGGGRAVPGGARGRGAGGARAAGSRPCWWWWARRTSACPGRPCRRRWARRRAASWRWWMTQARISTGISPRWGGSLAAWLKRLSGE